MKKLIALLLFLSIFSGCNGDGVKDKDFEDGMLREAMCIVASERFLLYNEAKRHIDHGIAAGRDRLTYTKQENDFQKQVQKVRPLMVGMSKEYNAEYLKNRCGRPITNGEYNDG